MNFFQKSVLESKKDDNSVQNRNIFLTQRRKVAGCAEGVGEKSWSWRAKLAVERKSERADTAYSPRFREEELPDADNERNCGGGAKLAARVGCVFGI